MPQSVYRSIDVLFFVAEEPSGRSLADIARALDLNKTTAFRLAKALKDKALFRQDPITHRYFSGDGLFRLVGLLENSDQVREVALPYMNELRDKTRETVCLVVAKGLERQTTEVLPGHYDLRLVPKRYSSRPLYTGAPGKALLAHVPDAELKRVIRETKLARVASGTITSPEEYMRDLARIRQRGYATSLEETDEGGAAVAAPIFDFRGEVVAAVNVHGPRFRFKPNVLKEFGQLAADAAKRISLDLGAPLQPREVKAGMSA